MDDYVEVKLTLTPNDAAMLIDLAGGEDQIDQYAAEVIQNLHSEEQAASADAYAEPTLDEDVQSLIDMSG